MKTLKALFTAMMIAAAAGVASSAVSTHGSESGQNPEIAAPAGITVGGTVTDAADDSPVAGVSVILTGTGVTTMTDIDGRYSIRAHIGDKLEFSFPGYASRTVEVTGPVLNVQMTVEMEMLEEVVVAGYGTESSKSFSRTERSYDDAEMAMPAEMESMPLMEAMDVHDYSDDGWRDGRLDRRPRRQGAGVITAGEWNDLEHWKFWRNLLQRNEYRRMPEYWGFEGIDKALPFKYAQGRNAAASFYRLDRTIEVAFMVDATGSMSDELEFLKTELVDVVGRVRGSNPGSEVLTGSVFYRDRGDEYVTRVSPFTHNIAVTADFIREQYASGGGDYPEAVHTAFDKSVSELQWSEGARTKLLFMLLDAPPHHEPGVLKSLHASVDKAAAQGIRVIPIVASGIDKETEFLMRFVAISTGGTYVFITDDSGIGNDHLEASVGQYDVEFLNDLIVRLINKYAQ